MFNIFFFLQILLRILLKKVSSEKQIRESFFKNWREAYRKDSKFNNFLQLSEFHLTQQIYQKFFSKLRLVSESIGKQKLGVLKLKNLEIRRQKSFGFKQMKSNSFLENGKEIRGREYLFGLRIKAMKLM